LKKRIRPNAIALLLVSMMLVSSLAFFQINTATAQSPMAFTTGETISFGSNADMTFWSGQSFRFGTGIKIQFVEQVPNGILQACDYMLVLNPQGFVVPPCSWWELLDPLGQPYIEFHVDFSEPGRFHIDQVIPGPSPLPQAPFYIAEKKIEIVQPCMYFVVHQPLHWYPPVCSWWEIMDPETHLATGFEFHVDWNNESCEFHIDEMIPGPYLPPGPWYYELEARRKIQTITPCDTFTIIDPAGYAPEPCSWWEVLNPATGQPTDLEFHVDQSGGGVFHVDQVDPAQLSLPWGPSYSVHVRKKVDIVQECGWFKVWDPATVPKPCTWWKIISPTGIGDIEFHVDESNPDGSFHVDYVSRPSILNPPLASLVAEQKFTGISPCDWFTVLSPVSWVPAPCTWWRITWPTQWAGVTFHVDSNDGISSFHVDSVDPLSPGPTPPPWNVTAEPYTPPDPWYWKPTYRDYVPSGMPDFDQRQSGAYLWKDLGGAWSHCGPVAVANSLWWLDSEFEPNAIPPPAISDGYPLVRAYGAWDDHGVQNLPPLVEHLAFLMDTDGRRTGLPGLPNGEGTRVNDMQAGLTHYLSWTGVNPQGDVNGDGIVDPTDQSIVMAAMGTVPGMPNWNLAADVFPASATYPPIADNIINVNDLALVISNMGRTGMFYEHTVGQPTFDFIVNEVKKCQDVVLLLGYWYWSGNSWYREAGHFVTTAGVNNINSKIGISDPIRDAFENGLIPEGRIPTPHVHMPPEPPYITHNNAAYVSQDIYSVTTLSPPMPPCPGGNLILVNYPGVPGPGWFAVVEQAVVTSPYGVHDVAVTNVQRLKTIVGKTRICKLNVTVTNEGTFTETFNVTTWAMTMPPATNIQSRTILNLLSGETRTITFTWDTTTWAYGNYTVGATADTVTGETDVSDNTFTDSWVFVTIIGDCNGDRKVNVLDLILIASHLGHTNGDGHTPFTSDWYKCMNTDLNDDNAHNVLDLILCANHLGQSW